MIWAFYMRSVPFTRGVISGAESLGGSESACIGLARALVRRGHDVLIFAHQLDEDARGLDDGGVLWVDAREMRSTYLHWQYDVFVSLRMMEAFVHPGCAQPVNARWRVLWNQDLLIDAPKGTASQMVANSWGIDTFAYVSEYHRKQWEGVQSEFAPLGWVTRNGFDPTLVPDPATITKDWRRIIHISRPERGLGPLLRMWPDLKRRIPEAELQVCRYNSMYDRDGWGRICAAYDDDVAAVNAEVGGITYLGELGKPALYQAIAEAAVMWYPGISSFAETSCIAAIEAQANGTPIVCSNRGALAETVGSDAGVLVDGVAENPQDEAYRTHSVTAVASLVDECRRDGRLYRERVKAGRAHVFPRYTFDAIAADWEAKAEATFRTRWQANPKGVIRALLNVDDHVAAEQALITYPARSDAELADANARCVRVIAGKDQGAEDYAQHASLDPIRDGKSESRFAVASHLLKDCTHVLDVACGNGAMAFKLAQDHPTMRVTGVDYSPALIARCREWADQLGLSDRVTFEALPVYDYDMRGIMPIAQAWLADHAESFDGAFCGEFLEHCANAPALIDAIESACAEGATIVYTLPHGPFIELMEPWRPIQRGHVHHWEIDDLRNVFGAKDHLSISALDYGTTLAGSSVGGWIVRYQVGTDPVVGARWPTGDRNLTHRILTTRPRPFLSVLILANDDALDLRRCLTSVQPVADEIVIGDSSRRSTHVADVAREFHARVVNIPSPTDLANCPDGFAGARNAVLSCCTGDWVLWIDTDETLEGAAHLRKHLESGPFNGYALRQNHLMLDAPQHFDTPVRVFRRRPDIQFYGCVHEQPQMGDCNGEIIPALEIVDVQIAHVGYRTEQGRKVKSDRNLPLLLANRSRFPTRRLNGVLEVRECAIRGNDALRRGEQAEAARLFTQAILAFEKDYGDPTDRTGQLARPFYEMALSHLPESWEFEYAFAGSPQELNGKRAQLKRVRVRRYEDIEAIIMAAVRDAKTGMQGTPPPDTTPWTPTPVASEVAA